MLLVFFLLGILTIVSACGMSRDLIEERNLVKTAIMNVHIWEGNKFSHAATTVVFINGRLALASPVGATIIDGKGGYLVPGFIDAHCHITSCSYLDLMRQYGVTTALDMGSFPFQQSMGAEPLASRTSLPRVL